MQPAGAEQTPFKPREEGTIFREPGQQEGTVFREQGQQTSGCCLSVHLRARGTTDAASRRSLDEGRFYAPLDWEDQLLQFDVLKVSSLLARVVTILSQVDTYFDNGFIGSWFEFRFTHNLLLLFLAIKMSLKPRHHPSINQSGYLLRSNLLYF